MDKIKYSIYDLIGYFIPGSLVLWLLLELLNVLNFNYNNLLIKQSHFSIQVGIIFIASYTVGHLLHTIANFTIDKLPSGSYPPKKYFPEKFENDFSKSLINVLEKSIHKQFNVPTRKDKQNTDFIKDSYWLCYSYVVNSKHESLTQTFLSISGFYRGLAIGFYVISIIYMIAFLFKCQLVMLIVSLSSFVIGQLFFLRNARFKFYLAKTVYSDFLTLQNINKDNVK